MVWPIFILAFAGGGTGAAATTGGVTAGSVLFYGSAVAAGTAGGLYLRSRTQATTCVECNQGQEWRVVAQAQGTDVGGTSSSTISAGAVHRPQPVTKAEGIAKVNELRGLLNRTQLRLREDAFSRAERYILQHAYLGKKSFEVRNVSGGARVDVDSYGPSDNFVA